MSEVKYLLGPAGTEQMAWLIQRRMREKKMDIPALAARIGKSRSFVRNVVLGFKPVTKRETLQAIATALDLDPYEIHAAQNTVPHDMEDAIRGMNYEQLKTIGRRIGEMTA